ncbi:MAG: hypothetical protein PW999_09990 [Paraburkholderia tropica]|nr:hypothetical protein [Paraburkholderia tropica]
MGRPPKATNLPEVEQEAPAQPAKFVLKKNHGVLTMGRASQFYAAGTEFDSEADANLIAQLIQSGAILEQI